MVGVKTIQVRVNGTIPGFYPGQVVDVQVGDDGVPVLLSWRRRFRDAKIDHCCEIVVEPEGPEKATEPDPTSGKLSGDESDLKPRRQRRQRSER